MNSCREAFEAWITSRSWYERLHCNLKQTSDGNYCHYKVNDRWVAWQAALAHASSATTNPQESSSRLVDAAVLAELTAWLTREMPAGTIIGSPEWWARRIAGRVHIAIDQAIAGRRGDGNG